MAALNEDAPNALDSILKGLDAGVIDEETPIQSAETHLDCLEDDLEGLDGLEKDEDTGYIRPPTMRVKQPMAGEEMAE